LNNVPDAFALEILLLTLNKLKSITLARGGPPPSAGVVDHLGRLKSLVNWQFVEIPSTADLTPYTVHGGRFPALRKFAFTTDSICTVRDILTSMKCPFKDLSITCGRPNESPVPLSTLCEVIDRILYAPISTSLSRLSLTVHSNLMTNGQSGSAVLGSLFRLSALKEIDLHGTLTIGLDDTWLRDASLSWPHLRKLYITPPLGSEDRPTMTLSGLIPLLKNCPFLEDLGVSLILAPFPLSSLAGGKSNWGTDMVHFPSSILESPTKVCSCLRLMFPRLRICTGTTYPEEAESREKWDLVNRWVYNSALED
jgi:hypothetical protein